MGVSTNRSERNKYIVIIIREFKNIILEILGYLKYQNCYHLVSKIVSKVHSLRFSFQKDMFPLSNNLRDMQNPQGKCNMSVNLHSIDSREVRKNVIKIYCM